MRYTWLALGLVAWGAQPSNAHALPVAPGLFCQNNPTAPACAGRNIECSYCHTATAPAGWNAYGEALKSQLDGQDFEGLLPRALQSTGALDSDGDGFSNADETAAGSLPGDASSHPSADEAASYDYARAFRRVHVKYCGRSPSYDEARAFTALGNAERQRAAIRQALDVCLAASYWRDHGVQRLGDTRIRPVQPVGREGQTPLIIIGDYEWDYRLWTYVLTDDRDMRELLRADYHVEKAPDGTLVKREGVIAPPPTPTTAGSTYDSGALMLRGSPQGQPLEPERRAGMLTTSWFFAVNTMFSALPRTTAAQAYRAYLGEDIALQQGLHPVAGEPTDIDARGVGAPVCRDCHSTLDPMSYAFLWYEGILGRDTGKFKPNRPGRIAGWKGNQGLLLGQPINDVKDFARVALESELFPRNLALIFLRHAIEREPSAGEQVAFETLWRGIPADGWSANKLIHRIVESSFFGGAQ